MKYEKNRKIAGIDEYQLFSFFKILALPLIALILIIIIVIVDRIPNKKASATEAASSELPGDAADNDTYTYDFSEYGISANTIPEIDTLISEYQKAKVTGDAETIFRLYGRPNTEGIDVLQARMNEEKKFYEDFLETELYTASGVSEGSYLVLIKTNVKFKKISTPAPTLIWTYVIRDENGNYIMKDSSALSEEEIARKQKLFESEDVILLSNEVNSKLTEAVINDVKLSNLYQLLNEGGQGIPAPNATDEESEENTPESIEESYEDIDIGIAPPDGAPPETAAETQSSAEEEAPAESSQSEASVPPPPSENAE